MCKETVAGKPGGIARSHRRHAERALSVLRHAMLSLPFEIRFLGGNVNKRERECFRIKNNSHKQTDGVVTLRLQHNKGPMRPVRYHTLLEHRQEVADSAVMFHPVRALVTHSSLHQISYSLLKDRQPTNDSSGVANVHCGRR
ncbi:hypothetical protein EVAR_38320_1 [Eumeta japonica]|uniref:Uncharacterized protein n=1 Tax=Eumeta variegata TaxID=151549 RepID=A0A4C1X3F3_EUMVA|nr:hypothetical protein EVAR_38320_1 [Eumeta japonica]